MKYKNVRMISSDKKPRRNGKIELKLRSSEKYVSPIRRAINFCFPILLFLHPTKDLETLIIFLLNPFFMEFGNLEIRPLSTMIKKILALLSFTLDRMSKKGYF